MTKPVTIPNTFATATTAIPLSQLDSDFSAVATALNDANTYSNYAADTGVANAYVVTLTGVSTTYSAGLRIQFKAGAANTGASTLNVNGGGTKNITFQDASALSSGTIAANAIVDVMYDGTQFLLMNDPAGTVGTGDVVGPAGATANAAAIFDSTTGKLIKDSKVIITPVANSSTLTIANNKTVTVNNTLALSGTDSTTMTFPSTNATIARTDAAQTFTGVQTFSTAIATSSGGTGLGGVSPFTANGVLYASSASALTSGSALTFDGTNLGVGIASPTDKLDASGTSRWRARVTNAHTLQINTNAAGSSYADAWHDASTHLWQISGSELMRLTSTGLGIGTSSPSSILDVQKAGTAAATTDLLELTNSGNAASMTNTGTGILFNQFYYDATTPAVADAGRIAVKTEGNWTSTGSTQDAYMTFETALDGTVAERARITSGGYFKASNSGSYIDPATFHEFTQTANSEALQVRATNASYTNTAFQVRASRNTTNNSFYYISCFNDGASNYRMRVADSGDVTNVNNSYAGISDLKLKQDIVDASSQWDDIKNLRVRKYRLKSDPAMPLHIGLVAQEAELVSPGLVDEHTDRDAENNDLGTKTKSVKYSILYMKAIKALQEAMTRIETLEAKVAQLEGTQP